MNRNYFFVITSLLLHPADELYLFISHDTSQNQRNWYFTVDGKRKIFYHILQLQSSLKLT